MLQSFGYVTSIIIPQNKSTSVLVYPFKGHQDWTILSRVKGVSKVPLAMKHPVVSELSGLSSRSVKSAVSQNFRTNQSG